jgi:hypothetical protein
MEGSIPGGVGVAQWGKRWWGRGDRDTLRQNCQKRGYDESIVRISYS